jgi:Xaa-Pro aminopeptidase
MGEIPNIIYEGIYEFELAAEIDYLMQKNGADKSAFTTISSFGRNSAEPHYAHGNVKLKKGDFVLCDFGSCYKKYNSDITRTFVYGKSSEKQKSMHKVVLEAQRIGFNEIKPGVIAHKVYDEVKKSIDDTEFKDRFIHALGHSIGLSVHDGGAGFSYDSMIELEENMVFTVEPGVYIPGFGGVRIEDDILINEDGIEILTKASRELIEIQ